MAAAPVASEPPASDARAFAPTAPQLPVPAAATPGEGKTLAADQRAKAFEPPALVLPSELSPWSMFLNADNVVKGVMIGLVAAASLVWMIWVSKWIQLWMGRRTIRADLAAIKSKSTLDAASASVAHHRSVARLMLELARAEKQLSGGVLTPGTLERIHSRLAESETSLVRQIRSGMGFLATVGATGPFVGLFGTVWGIMNSFIGISKSQTTNLAVVAPGIAEALLATAIGLVAAIPAVILYNNLGKAIASYRLLARETRGEVERIASREVDGLDGVRRLPSLASAAE
jgi:biopolymer transport protein ExbB